MDLVTDADRIRLAIAICALRLKPESQSIAACVLDLQDRFPLNALYNSDCTPWKSLAFKLERENVQLQTQLDAEKIRCLTLTSKCDASTSAAISTGSGSAPGYSWPTSGGQTYGKSKKARKKNTSDLHQREGSTDLPPCLTQLRTSCSSRTDPPLATLFPPMDAFSRLLSLDVSALPQNLTISITLRSVEAIADYLDFLLLSNKAHGLHHKKRLEALNSCLHYVLTHGVPLVVRFSKTSKRKRKRDTDDLEPQENPIDRFLELLRSRIFNHIVTTISYLSEVYLTRLLFPNASISHVTEVKHPGEQHDKPQTTPNDLRAGIVYIFESSVYLLCASLSSVTGVAKQSYATKLSTLCTSLMLSTSYELDKAIFRSSIALPLDALDGNYSSIQGSSNRPGNLSNGSEIGPDTNPGNYSNLHQRVMRLAIKDSVWYLCNIMHILFGGRTLVCSEGPWHQVGVGNKPRKDIKDINGYQANVVLLEATRDVLLRLVIKCQRKMKNNNSEPGNIDSLSDSDYHKNGYTSSRCPAQASDFENNNIVDLGRQIGLDALLDTNMLARGGGGKNIQRSCAKSRPTCKGKMEQVHLPTVDEVTYNMILGVVERFVLDAYHGGAGVH